MPHATKSCESATQPTTPASAMPTGLLNRFRDRIKSAHVLVGIALLGAASLPEIVQAQTSLPPITVIGTPPPGGGGFGGGGGGGGGDPTGCGYDCDGSANGGTSDYVARRALSTNTCQTPVAERLATANALSLRDEVFRTAVQGGYFIVDLADGGFDTWQFECITAHCALTGQAFFDAAPYTSCSP